MIGDNVLVGTNVKIFDTDFHDQNSQRRIAMGDTNIAIGKVVIGGGVFIGANAIIGKDSIIGEGAVIGAGAVVFGQEIPPRTVWVGNPARFLKDV